MAVTKSYEEINARIKKGEAVVVTAEEIIDLVAEKGVTEATRQVDVVTTGTFGAMCSSGAFLNFGHSRPRIKMKKICLNGVPAYGGLAAVDAYLGATELPESDPENRIYPGRFLYGGGHVIEDLVAGRPVKLEATGYGTDCYPRRHIETWVRLEDLTKQPSSIPATLIRITALPSTCPTAPSIPIWGCCSPTWAMPVSPPRDS